MKHRAEHHHIRIDGVFGGGADHTRRNEQFARMDYHFELRDEHTMPGDAAPYADVAVSRILGDSGVDEVSRYSNKVGELRRPRHSKVLQKTDIGKNPNTQSPDSV